ncbi:hypothetical protein [endosymbiont of Lamellibrachia barhami]|uniref:hypothetical protein n=1 Tax=endosymbiont of Lamellibrachia barhami TaxID=205975 RepID=UPI0015A9C465|nr:hypothetical protein [endosymbiont of Lamellibrachia barhami]
MLGTLRFAQPGLFSSRFLDSCYTSIMVHRRRFVVWEKTISSTPFDTLRLYY